MDAFGNSWEQAQLSLSRGGLGLRSLSHHSAAAYISSVSASEQCSVPMSHLHTSVNLFNALIPSANAITLDDVVSSPCHQHALSSKIENHQFTLLFDHSSLPDRARLLSVSSPNAVAWLSVLPSPGLNLHMDPPEFQVALKWWLGMDLAQGINCTFCPSLGLDPLGHHAITCKHWGDVVSCHNKLCDVFVECCRRANVSAQVEVGSGFGHDICNTRTADVLVPNWSLGKPAAFDLIVTSLLNPSILSEAGVMAGSAAFVAECCKHDLNDPNCLELGWKCTPIAVETYGCWGAEARETLSRLATRLAIPIRCTKFQATAAIYGRLSLTLVIRWILCQRS